MATTRGIRKVNENILSTGRALIFTDKDKDHYNWAEIPVGSIFIDTKTGMEYVKLENESDWVPSGIKNDGTLCIAKDTIIKEETFVIDTLADGDGNFTYRNSDGKIRHMPITSEGYHVFEVETGHYMPQRGQLEVWIDDVLRRDAHSAGVVELTEKRFALTEPLVVGMEITARYSSIFRVGNPYPRIFINSRTPEDSETGDFWLDVDATLADELGENIEGMDYKIPFVNITGLPTTLSGYGIKDKVSYVGHTHNVSEISGLPSALPANGGNADMVDYCHAGTSPGNVLKIPANGKIPDSMMPAHKHSASDIVDFGANISPIAQKLGRNGDTSHPMVFNWNGQGGQPAWLWGGNDGTNMYVYNPSNFNVAHAANADKLNGMSWPAVLGSVTGKTKPKMTPLIDWDKMKQINGGNEFRATNGNTGIFSYGGDTGSLKPNGGEGDIWLKQSYKNFDKILVHSSNDDRNVNNIKIWDEWLLEWMFENAFRFNILNDTYSGDDWTVYGTKLHGNHRHTPSTDTRWIADNQNSSIIEIYGLSY